MSVRKTLQIGDPLLKAENKEIFDFNSEILKDLIQDLKDTMRKGGLIGIAAPQIGENFSVFVTEPRETETRPADQADKFRVYVNPKIIYESEERVMIYEGCGSVCEANLYGPVIRSKVLTIEAFDSSGNVFQFKTDGILGRVIQHEYDHLQGIEFTEKIQDYSRLLSREHYIKQIKDSEEQKKASRITIKEFEQI